MYPLLKRTLDLCAALLGVVLLAPVLALLSLMVGIRLGRPVFFVQTRSGRAGRPFQMYKFRTMSDERDADGDLLPDGERLGKLGRFLRSTSLDELPELINVIRGEMSLVGPRPLLPEYDELYSARQARRLEMRPGITGLAQVRGRNALTWEDKFEYDVMYVERAGMLLDLRILIETFAVVFRRSGISQEGHDTAVRFEGTSTGENGQRT